MTKSYNYIPTHFLYSPLLFFLLIFMHQLTYCHTLPKPFFKIFLFRIYAPTIHSTDFELDETSHQFTHISAPIQPPQTRLNQTKPGQIRPSQTRPNQTSPGQAMPDFDPDETSRPVSANFSARPDSRLIRDAIRADAVVAGTRLLPGCLLTGSVNQSQALLRLDDRARLLAGRFDAAGVIQAQAACRGLDDRARLLAGLWSGQAGQRTESIAAHAVVRYRAPRPDYKSGLKPDWPSGGPSLRRTSPLSSLQACQALRLDCNRAFRPDSSIISPLEAGWPSGVPSVRPSGRTIIGPLGPIARSHMQVLPPLSSTSQRRRSVVAHAPLVGAGNLSELVECVGLRKPAALVSAGARPWA